MNEQPTDEQTKKLWEWCGLCMHDLKPKRDLDLNVFRLPDGRQLSNDGRYLSCVKCGYSTNHDFIIPEPDLNNLFRWVVPKALAAFGHQAEYQLDSEVLQPWIEAWLFNKEDPALSLAQAVLRVIEREKT